LFIEILFFTSITAILVNKLKIWNTIPIIIILLLGYYFSVVYYFKHNLILDLIYVPISILLTYFVMILFLFRNTQKSKNVMNYAFNKYVSSDLVNQMVNDPSKIRRSATKKKISILFSDIANFTSISEKLSPEKLIYFLNDYLHEMTEIIIKNDGYIDKYIGDAIMAFWEENKDSKNIVEKSCMASLQMIQKVRELKIKWKNEFGEDVDIRIGVNYGNVVVGNIGSEHKFDHTVIGDNVNLASRLEGVNKKYGTNLIISEFVYEKIKSKFITRELDYIKVKGKNKPIRIYEILISQTRTPLKDEFLNLFNKGLNLYRKAKFEEAETLFRKCYIKFSDKASKTFLDRCQILKEKNLNENWDGIFTMEDK